MAVSEENRQLARYLRGAIGGKVSVAKYWDREEVSSVDVLRAEDAPDPGIITFATLGLSDHDVELTLPEGPLRVELVMTAHESFEDTPNILSTCAFNIINSGFRIAPGIVHPDVVAMYRPGVIARHIFYVSPFLVPLETQRLPGKVVTWLQAVPISEAEARYHAEHGAEALEDALEAAEADVYDLDRESVIA